VYENTKIHNLPRLGGAQYRNPLTFTDGQTHTNPDPFGFKHRGRYYTYSTHTDGVSVSVSDDLVMWEHRGFALQIEGRRNFWAPCMIYDDGTFYLYVSSTPADSTDSHDERLHLATSNNPCGPFTLVTTFFDKFSIDPHVVKDIDGSAYLFYSTNDVTGLNSFNAGTSILVDRLIAFDQLAGEPTAVVVPTLPEEIFEEDRFGDGRDWHTIEGATFLRRQGRAYLTYSGNAYVRENYFVGYSRAVDATNIGDLEWTKYPSNDDFAPLIRRNSAVEGTGHNSIVIAPNLVDSWIMYHGRDASETLTPDFEQRTMRLDPLFFDGDTLATNAPSSEIQDAPAQPDVRDLFTDPSLGNEWQVVGGLWSSGLHEAKASPLSARALVVTSRTFGSYRAEIDLAAVANHAGARFGIVPTYFAVDDLIELTIDTGLQRITATRVRGNVEQPVASAPLPDIRVSSYHQLIIDRSVGTISILFDGVPLLDFEAHEGEAAFGLLSTHTEALFSGFSITEHVELWGERLGVLDRFYTANRRVSASPSGISAPTGRSVELRSHDHRVGVAYEHEFEILSRARGQVEFFAEYVDEANYLRIEADWTSAKITRVVAGEEELLTRTSLTTPRFTVRTVVMHDRIALRVGSVHLVLPTSSQYVSQRMRLTASKLRSFQATSAPDDTIKNER